MRVLKGNMGTGICSFSVLGIAIFMSFITVGCFHEGPEGEHGNWDLLIFSAGNCDFHVFYHCRVFS